MTTCSYAPFAPRSRSPWRSRRPRAPPTPTTRTSGGPPGGIECRLGRQLRAQPRLRLRHVLHLRRRRQADLGHRRIDPDRRRPLWARLHVHGNATSALPWSPRNHGCVQAGDAQFVAESVVRGQITYTRQWHPGRQDDRAPGAHAHRRGRRLPRRHAHQELGAVQRRSRNCPTPYQLVVTEKAASIVEIARSLQGATDCIMEGLTVQTGRVSHDGRRHLHLRRIRSARRHHRHARTSNGGIEPRVGRRTWATAAPRPARSAACRSSSARRAIS